MIAMNRSGRARGLGTVPGVAAIAVTALVGAALGLLLGGFGTVLVVSSGSMAPVLKPGDAVLDRFVPAHRVGAGQVVTFFDQGRGVLVTHRVVSVEDIGDRRQFVTRGDANTGVEIWSIDRDGPLGLLVGRVPHAGYPLAWLSSEPVMATLYLLLAVIVGRAVIGRIWASRRW